MNTIPVVRQLNCGSWDWTSRLPSVMGSAHIDYFDQDLGKTETRGMTTLLSDAEGILCDQQPVQRDRDVGHEL